MKNNALLKLLFLIGLSFCFKNFAVAQQKEGAWWFFGDVGLHFTGQSVANIIKPSIVSSVGSATVSDAKGNLLFYTVGGRVMNRNHQEMPRLIFPSSLGVFSSLDMIVQSPAHPENYYLFFQKPVGTPPNSNISRNNLYAIQIDMRLDNGMGDVVPNTMQLLHTFSAKKMAALLHSNNRDIWVVTQNATGDSLFSYLISPSGISQPLGSPTGTTLDGWGRLKNSPNSQLLAATDTTNVHVFEFNRSTGVPTSKYIFLVPVFQTPQAIHSCAFSPNSSKLYVGTRDNDNYNIPLKSGLFQYDLASGSQATVQSSQTLLHSFDSTYAVDDLQLGIDGFLYVLVGGFKPLNLNNNKFLSRIFCPDQPGLASRFQFQAIDLLGKRGGQDLPSLNQTIFRNAGILQAQAFQDTICYGDSVQLSAYGAGAEHFQWQVANGLILPNDTLSNPFVKPTQTTTYSVTGSSVCSQHTASVTVVVLPKPVITVSGSASVCPQVQGVWYKAQNPQRQQISWGIKGGTIVTSSNDSISVDWGSASNTAQVWALPKNSLGCTGDTVFFPVNINVILATEKPKGADTLCLNEAKNVAYRINKTTGSVYTWGIKGGTIVSGQGSNSINVNWQQTGTGKLWVQEESHTSTSHCFGVSDTLNVLMQPLPDSVMKIMGPTQVFTFAENQTYHIENPKPDLTYNWQVNGGAIISGQKSHSVSVNWGNAGTGLLEVSAANVYGCESGKVGLKVEISGAPLPVFYNIITPNNDGKNDAFVIGNLKWYAENELVIYNRWGVEVFRKRNYQNDWQAEKVSSGVYFYRFTSKGKSWKGWLEVVK